MCVDDLIYDVEKEKAYDLALEAYIRVQGVPEYTGLMSRFTTS